MQRRATMTDLFRSCTFPGLRDRQFWTDDTFLPIFPFHASSPLNLEHAAIQKFNEAGDAIPRRTEPTCRSIFSFHQTHTDHGLLVSEPTRTDTFPHVH